jgi:hypothetical protein
MQGKNDTKASVLKKASAFAYAPKLIDSCSSHILIEYTCGGLKPHSCLSGLLRSLPPPSFNMGASFLMYLVQSQLGCTSNFNTHIYVYETDYVILIYSGHGFLHDVVFETSSLSHYLYHELSQRVWVCLPCPIEIM